MRRVLFIVPGFNRSDWGATENLVWNLAKSMTASRLAQCDIVSFQREDVQPAEEAVSGVFIHRFPEARERRIRMVGDHRLPPDLAALAEFLNRKDFDVVHHFLTGRKAAFLAGLLRRKKIPFIMHCLTRDFQTEAARRRFFELPWMRRRRKVRRNTLPQMINQNRKALASAELLLTTGRSLQGEFEKKLPRSRVQSFAPGVDFDYFSRPSGAMFRSFFQIPESQPILLCVGRIGTQNNQKFLLELLAVLNRRNHRCRLVFLGYEVPQCKGYVKSLLAMAEERGLGEYVTVIPGLPPGDDRFRAAYQAASVMLLPSRINAEGSAVLEAWTAGVPVIAAPSGEAGDLIEDGINGRLAGSHQFTDWVSSAESMLNERLRNMHEAMRSAGIVRAREHDWSLRAAELMMIYDSVIENYRKRRLKTGGSSVEEALR